MTRDVATATPEASVKDVVWSLLYNKVSALPVVDPRHRPVGMVSETDLLRRQPGLPNSKGDSREAITAGDLMTTPVWTVCPECSLATATRMISEHGVGRLPVIDAAWNTGRGRKPLRSTASTAASGRGHTERSRAGGVEPQVPGCCGKRISHCSGRGRYASRQRQKNPILASS